MAKIAKRVAKANEAFAGKANISVEDAVKLIKGAASAKFDETIEIAMNLGVDPRHADQMVRGVVALPNDASEALHRSLGFTHVGNAGVGAQVREADRLRLLATDEPAAALTLTKLSVCIPRVGSAGAVSAPFNAALIVKCIGAECKWSRKCLRGESNRCTIKA